MIRCRRLKRECRPAETSRRRNPRKPATPKTTRLEEKLDDILSFVRAGAQPGAVTTSSHPTATIDDSSLGGIIQGTRNTPTHNESERGSTSSRSNDYIHNAQVLTPATDDCTGLSYDLLSSGFRETSGEPSSVEAEQYLADFQAYKLKYFPFVHISSTMTAQQLQQERPFLWLCIMAVGSKSTSQQQILGSKIRQMVAQEIVVQSQKNIDLLLGLLTFIGWYGTCQHQNSREQILTTLT